MADAREKADAANVTLHRAEEETRIYGWWKVALGPKGLRAFILTHEDKATKNLMGTGPGIFDMKGGLVIGLYALAAIRELGLSPAHRLVFLFNSDEEVGSHSSLYKIV